MSLGFEFKKEAEEESTGQENPADEKDFERYDTPGHLRYVVFIDNNGKRSCQFYSWLSSIDFVPDKNEITLEFSRVTIRLKGQHLGSLFDELSAQVSKQIKSVDKRYISLIKADQTVVTEISVESRE